MAPIKKKIVCLIVRNDAYCKSPFNESKLNKEFVKDWSYHNYRDCNVESFKLAYEFLANEGYKVFRMRKK